MVRFLRPLYNITVIMITFDNVMNKTALQTLKISASGGAQYGILQNELINYRTHLCNWPSRIISTLHLFSCQDFLYNSQESDNFCQPVKKWLTVIL